jgi:hypothetical protein
MLSNRQGICFRTPAMRYGKIAATFLITAGATIGLLIALEPG